MNVKTNESRVQKNDESIEHEFDAERRKKIIIGALVFVLGALATFGILYYFGMMSAVGW